jgi:hypothetical protein
MVTPRIGTWLSSPVSCPPSIGVTSVIVVVMAVAITIRNGRSQVGTARRACRSHLGAPGPVPFGHHHTINPIPPNATSAPATGDNPAHRNPTASATYNPPPTSNDTAHDRLSAITAYPRSNPAATSSPGNELAATAAANAAP